MKDAMAAMTGVLVFILIVGGLIAFPFLIMRGETALGPCIGVTDKENPKLEYRISKRNLLIGIVFVESLVVPGYVALYNLKCPMETK